VKAPRNGEARRQLGRLAMSSQRAAAGGSADSSSRGGRHAGGRRADFDFLADPDPSAGCGSPRPRRALSTTFWSHQPVDQGRTGPRLGPQQSGPATGRGNIRRHGPAGH